MLEQKNGEGLKSYILWEVGRLMGEPRESSPHFSGIQWFICGNLYIRQPKELSHHKRQLA